MANEGFPSTMRAWQYSTGKKPFESNLSLNTIPILKVPSSGLGPKTRSVLVKVHAVSLNPADYKVPTIPILGYFINSKPATPAVDFSGVIVALPKDTSSKLKVGDRVIGRLDFPYQHGTLAEYVLGQPGGLVKLPDSASFEEGAAIGTGALTALQPLEARLKPGESVFINGGSGGVGSFSTQFAKLLGAGHVTVTCGPANVERVKGLGADEVINYRETNVITALKTSSKDSGRMYDLIVENVGDVDKLYEESHHFLKPTGHFVQVAAPNPLFFMKRAILPGFLGGGKRSYSFFLVSNNEKQFQAIADWLAEGKLKVEIDEVFKFEDAKEAFVKLAGGRAKGKIVVKVAED